MRKQAEWERERAVEEAKLAVQTANLAAERSRFEDQMEFHRSQIANEMGRLERVLDGLMERLPSFTAALSVGGNGHVD